MSRKDVEHEIARLRAELHRHNRLYYNDANPEISDQEFDRLLKSLEAMEAEHPDLITPDSPTQRVGGEPLAGFTTVEHALPMLSIDNTYDYGEVREWDVRVRKGLNADESVRYVVEIKVDGVAVSLRYEKGRFQLGATRGDGERGDDITSNLRTVREIPLVLEGDDIPPLLEIRGEVFMTNAELIRINEGRLARELLPFANPRNSTAGSLKLLDPKLCAERRLRFVSHGIGREEGLGTESYTELLSRMKRWGIPVSEHTKSFDSIEEVIAQAELWSTKRNTLDFQTDGLVVKVDSLAQRRRLGARSKSPRWVIAYKYEAEQAVSKVLGISVQVGKTGKLTPVAELQAVVLAGTTVKRATLHNVDEIARKDIRIGDTVVVQKAGEIIPQVVRVEIDGRDGMETPFIFPEVCPSCSGVIERIPGEVDLHCPNPPSKCPEQLKEWVRWYAHRDAMDIDGLGFKLIDQLVERGLVKSLADLYRLQAETLADLERMGKKSAANLVAAVEASKTRSLDRLLTGLTIRHVGIRSAEVLAERFKTIEGIQAATLEELENVPEIGSVVAASVHEFFQDVDNQALLDDLKQVGVQPRPFQTLKANVQDLPFAGMTFVLTGTLPKRTRPEMERLIKSLGGKTTGSISKSTTYLVAGEEAGSKLEKAKGLNVKIIDEATLETMAGVGPGETTADV